jgi:hypothetical protein
MVYSFYVFPTLAAPLVVCRQFLKETQSFTKLRSQFAYLTQSLAILPRVCCIGIGRDRLHCSIDGEDAEALPDYGSDADLISFEYAIKRGFKITATEELLMFADGAIEKARGTVTAQLVVGHGAMKFDNSSIRGLNTEGGVEEESEDNAAPTTKASEESSERQVKEEDQRRNVFETKMYVVDFLAVDVLIGETSLESMEVYSRHQAQIIQRPTHKPTDRGLNLITLVGNVESKLRKLHNSLFRNIGTHGKHIAAVVTRFTDECRCRSSSVRPAMLE